MVFSLDTPAVTAGGKAAAKAEPAKRAVEGALWDEKSALAAVRGWLAKNPGAKRLPAAERAKIEKRHAKRLVAGKTHATELRAELARLPLQAGAPGEGAAKPAKEEAGKEPAPERPARAVLRKVSPDKPAKRIEQDFAKAQERTPERAKTGREKPPQGRRDAAFPYDPARVGGEPEGPRLSVPGPANARNVTIMSPEFPGWMDRALRQKTAEGGIPLDWSLFPKLKNRYGRRVTPRMFVMAVVLIESRGIQRRGGRLFEAGGYAGFMQLGRSYPKKVRGDGGENLKAGVAHLYPSFHKIFVKDAASRKGEPTVDRLLMVGACYNRGNYSRASKMRWKDLVARTKPVPLERRRYTGLHDNRIAVFYGLQMKGYLGMPFTAEEKRWLRAFRNFRDVGPWAEKKYAQMRNALLWNCKVEGGR